MNSILSTIKQLLGVSEDADDFDQELIVFINFAMGILHRLGIGDTNVFSITNASTTWSQFLGTSKELEMAKTYVYMKVKLVFDPPTIGYVLEAYKEIVAETEFRLTNQADIARIDSQIIVEGE